ncbi:hypothetical protein [Bradyrhizobium erythrophlei]|uniref:hypothetical protein n=1 Tax=Bradyrhizobium erythrophlei TaxID=1437360 RepID=UPI0009A750E1|nr:hypothetical protein [Bradyrhizobium erythrophlei]
MKKPKPLVEIFAELLDPYGTPPEFLQELRGVLHEAAKRAGWRPPSAQEQLRQHAAARGRKIQRGHDLAHRRLLTASFFKQLPRRLQSKHGSLATAQAIIRRIEELPWDKVRKPPMTVRTIQADIQFLRETGNFFI